MSFDPGKNTGYSAFISKEPKEFSFVRAGAFEGLSGIETLILGAMEMAKGDPSQVTVICEDYYLIDSKVTMKTAKGKGDTNVNYAMYPIQAIGVIRFLCEKLNIKLVMQAPGLRKGMEMRFADFDPDVDHTQSPHAKSATYHLLTYAQKLYEGQVIKVNYPKK